MRIFSFFSGSGFLDLGFEVTGYSIDLVNEISPAFMSAYKYAREKMCIPEPIHGYNMVDINEYLGEKSEELRKQVSKSRELGTIVGFIGGPPCPDFSVAGKQKGKNGDNGKLSLSYIKLIIEQQPDFFLFENVKGLWKTEKHRAYYEELKEMLLPYYTITDRLTNSLEFGVPQDRDRILMFGVNRKLDRNAEGLAWEKYIKYSVDEVKRLPWSGKESFESECERKCPDDVIRELTVQYWFDKNDVEHHPNGGEHFTPRTGIAKMSVVDEGDDSRKSYKRIHRWRYSPTVCYGNNEVHLHPYKIRRLSVSEALALQSMPKEFVLPQNMSLTDKFKTIGNGVPFLLSEGIAKTIKDFFMGGECND